MNQNLMTVKQTALQFGKIALTEGIVLDFGAAHRSVQSRATAPCAHRGADQHVPEWLYQLCLGGLSRLNRLQLHSKLRQGLGLHSTLQDLREVRHRRCCRDFRHQNVR